MVHGSIKYPRRGASILWTSPHLPSSVPGDTGVSTAVGGTFQKVPQTINAFGTRTRLYCDMIYTFRNTLFIDHVEMGLELQEVA